MADTWLDRFGCVPRNPRGSVRTARWLCTVSYPAGHEHTDPSGSGVHFWGGWQVRRIRKRQPARIGPLAAARVAVLAQSGSRGGALLFGAFAILAVLYNRSGSSDYVTAHVRAAAAAAVASAVLALVGYLVESWCNVSGDDDGGGTDPIPREPHAGTAVRGKPSKQLENFPLGG